MTIIVTLGKVLLFILCFGGWPLFLMLRFRSNRNVVVIVVGLSLVALWASSIFGGIGAAFRTPAPLYAWLVAPYLLAVWLMVRRRSLRSKTALSADLDERH